MPRLVYIGGEEQMSREEDDGAARADKVQLFCNLNALVLALKHNVHKNYVRQPAALGYGAYQQLAGGENPRLGGAGMPIFPKTANMQST